MEKVVQFQAYIRRRMLAHAFWWRRMIISAMTSVEFDDTCVNKGLS